MNRAHARGSLLRVLWNASTVERSVSLTRVQPSTAKGETLADTARMVTNYADLIVVRHNWAGAARVIAHHAHVPVINGGDGSHTHPTQALADLYTIMRRKSQIQGLTIGICGDLQFGRAAHSFALAVARFGGNLIHIAPETAADAALGCLHNSNNAMGQIPLEVESIIEVIDKLDVIYVNRLQEERLPPNLDAATVRGSYLLNAAVMTHAKPDAMIMHPLPRVNETRLRVRRRPACRLFRAIRERSTRPDGTDCESYGIGTTHLNTTSRTRCPLLLHGRVKTQIALRNHETYLTLERERLRSDVKLDACAYCGNLFS